MGNVTSDLAIWTPDAADLAKPDVYLATMAQSIEDGAGTRLRKLESFVGCNLCMSSALTVTSTTAVVAPFIVTQPYNFADGVTANPDGSVQIITAGIYQINFNASFLPANTTPARINTYIYKNGQSLGYSSTYGEAVTSRYSNCNVAGVYKLVAGDVITARVSIADSNSIMQGVSGSGLSMALTARS